MIDTAYSLTSFPGTSPTRTPSITFKKRPVVQRKQANTLPVSKKVNAVAGVVPAAEASFTAQVASRAPARNRVSYFVIGFVLLFAIVQAGAWIPFEGVDLLFVRLLLGVGACVCFLASGDAG